MIRLSNLDLALAAMLIVMLSVLSWRLRLGVSKPLLFAALRTTVQLSLIGLVLKVLFESAHWWWVLLMALTMLGFAAREVYARQKWRLKPGLGWGVGTFSMLISSFSVTIFALIALIGVEPWYAPQYAIPLLGMMLGNTMNGISLSLDHISQALVREQRVIEQRLALGAQWHESIAQARADSMRVGMMPLINGMAAAGIVSLPGMMTGQILAGTPPMEAVKYQILIMFMVAAGTGFGTVVAVVMASRRFFDERQRLRLDKALISPPGSDK